MKNKLLISAPLLAITLMSIVAATGSFSLRGSGGTLNYLDSYSSFVWSNAQFSTYFTQRTDSGQGSIIIQATTTSGHRIYRSITFSNPAVLSDTPTTLIVSNDGFYYLRTKTWSGLPFIDKVRGKVTYTLDRTTSKVTVVGTNGMNFKVSNIPVNSAM